MKTFMDFFNLSGAETNAPADPDPVTCYCNECRNVVVAGPDDLCQRCTAEWAQSYRVLHMAGRCTNGAESDHGTLRHAVEFSKFTAMCGAKPGPRSVGWTIPVETDVTCSRCLKAIENTNRRAALAAKQYTDHMKYTECK